MVPLLSTLHHCTVVHETFSMRGESALESALGARRQISRVQN